MTIEIEKGKDNKILREKTQSVDKIDEEILTLAKDMIETMEQSNGIGLAANQIGRNLRMFILPKNLCEKQIFINPEIIKMSKNTYTIEEGCLSLPGVFLPTERAKSLKIKAIDKDGKRFKLKADDLLARVIQHEIDHLNGILITDYE